MSFLKNRLGTLLALLYITISIIILFSNTEGSWGSFLLFVSALPFSILSLFLSSSGFAFEVQLSITEKGQYAVAYGLRPLQNPPEIP